MKKLLWLCCLGVLWAAALTAGCGEQADEAHTVILYSNLDESFVQTLADSYNSRLDKKDKLAVRVAKKDSDPARADVILAGTDRLQQLAAQGALQPVKAESGDRLPAQLRDPQDLWIGAFYDPAVLLVNQAYSRELGQGNLAHWMDLTTLSSARIAMENLTNSPSTKHFLAALSSRMGQDACLAYFRTLRPMIRQFSKYPISPVRMAATGDADIAITRRSQVFKYLQNDFPAYVLIPSEGTPVDLYGVALSKGSTKGKASSRFIDWLLQEPAARTVLVTARSGFLPVLPQGKSGPVANPDVLWLNTFYKGQDAVDRLADLWMKEIRLDTPEVTQ